MKTNNLPITFNDYLNDRFFDQHPEVLDDDMPDRFNDWLSEQDIDGMIEFGEAFRKVLIEKMVEDAMQIAFGTEMSEGEYNSMKKQLKAKWLGENNDL